MREGIHRPDPNPSCIQVSHSFLMGISGSQAWRLDPGRGPDQDCERGLVPAFDRHLHLRRLDQSCSAEAQDPTGCDYICAGTGLSSARSVRGPAAEAEAASAADQQQPDAVLEDPIENMSSTPSDSINLPVFLRLRLFLLRKVHDICWELLIGYILHGICLSFKAPTVLLRKGHEVCWGFWIFCVVVYYISYFWDFGYILYGSCLSF